MSKREELEEMLREEVGQVIAAFFDQNGAAVAVDGKYNLFMRHPAPREYFIAVMPDLAATLWSAQVHGLLPTVSDVRKVRYVRTFYSPPTVTQTDRAFVIGHGYAKYERKPE